MRDEALKERIQDVYTSNYRVHGARKIWRELNRQGHAVARCTVERLMRELGIQGAVRGKRVITTIPGGQVQRAPDLVDRDFAAAAPNRRWVADFTHVKTWSATVYVAFVVDTFSRRIVGWSAATVKETVFVLDALEMAIWQRDRDQQSVQPGELIHHSDAGSQYTSFKLAEHLDAVGIAASIGSVGDAYDKRVSSHCTSSPIGFAFGLLQVDGGQGVCLAGRGAGSGQGGGRGRRSCRCTSRPRGVRPGATSRWWGR